MEPMPYEIWKAGNKQAVFMTSKKRELFFPEKNRLNRMYKNSSKENAQQKKGCNRHKNGITIRDKVKARGTKYFNDMEPGQSFAAITFHFPLLNAIFASSLTVSRQ